MKRIRIIVAILVIVIGAGRCCWHHRNQTLSSDHLTLYGNVDLRQAKAGMEAVKADLNNTSDCFRLFKVCNFSPVCGSVKVERLF